jgi:hypothetical protein
MIFRSLFVAMTITVVGFVFATSAFAEVRFGNNVRIGGHDVSNQTFNKKRRAEYYIYKHKPKNEGCRWRRNADDSRTKVCHLQRKRR